MNQPCRYCNGPVRKVFAIYCGEPCHIAFSTKARSEKRALRRLERLCLECKKPISQSRKFGAAYCGIACKHLAMGRRNPERTKAYKIRYYHKHKEQFYQSHKEKKASIRYILNKIKEQPCQDCKQSFQPACMQFDHRNPSEKEWNVSEIKGSFRNLVKELAKCDLVCANCHCIRTHNRRTNGC